MFTVVIAEKNYIDAIKNKNSLFFQNFIDNKEIAFCEWNTEGQTFQESVPDLVSLVGRHELWKAVIINPVTDAAPSVDNVNPFDQADIQSIIEFKKIRNDLERNSETSFFDNQESEEGLKEKWHNYYDGLFKLKKECYEKTSKNPLQKLATYLCFKKDMYYDYAGKNKLASTQEKETAEIIQNNNWIKREEIQHWLDVEHSLYGQRIDDPETSPEEKASLVERYKLLESAIDKLRFNQLSAEEYLEIKEQFEELHQTKSRLEEQFNRNLIIVKEELRRQMTKGDETINIYLPSEVYCIAQRTTESPFNNPHLAWENHFSTEYSDFVERNLLFDKMKFLVFDVLPSTHEGYRNDFVRFLYAVLLFASYEVPSGIIAARKLYRINSENNEKPLFELASAYSKKLDETHELINKEIEKIYGELPGMFSDTEAESRFSQDKNIECTFEKDFKVEELYADEKAYASPYRMNNDFEEQWDKTYRTSEKTLKRLLKQPRRSISRGVDSMHELSNTSVTEASRLTRFQVDDLRDLTQNRENEMVNMDVPNLYDYGPYKKRIAEKDRKIRKIIDGTMSGRTALVLGAICIGLFFLCFLPFIFNNRNTGDAIFVSVVFAVAFMAVVAVVLLVSLYFLHRPLRNAIADFNKELRDLVNEIETATGKVGKYLTKMAGVRRGNKILKFTENEVDSYSKDIMIRQKHQADIQRRKAFLVEGYGDYIIDDMRVDSVSTSPYDYNYSKNTIYDYPAPHPTGDYKTMEFLVAGNRIPVPTEFAVRLYLTMEEIYD